MKKFKDWVIKQDFVDLMKKISVVDTILLIILIIAAQFLFSGLKFILAIVIGCAVLSLLTVIPILIRHKDNMK